MGIQVNVEKKDIPANWATEVRSEVYPDQRCGGEDCHNCCGNACTVEVEALWVQFPQAGWVESYSPDSLCFDNKVVNMELVAELQAAGVRYTRG